MSLQRGNMKKGAPKYQNSFAFKHNPKSKKTERILAMPIQGLCEQCTNQIEWRKKYRKFKPLTQPANCIFCHQKCVLAAYHSACGLCAKERDICAKCCKKKEIVLNEKELAALRAKETKEFEESLEGMRERERRAQLRKVEKEREEEKRLRREAAGLVEGDAGYESYDEDEFDMDDDDLRSSIVYLPNESMSDGFCVIRVDGWHTWWAETHHGSVKVYVSIVLFFLSAVLAHPIARSIFFLLRKFSPHKWKWPDEARELMMWQTALVCRAGLLWIAVVVSRVSIFLCQWPGWLFGICFIIWVDAGGNVLREVIARKGIEGYTDAEKVGRTTLLHEGTTLAKMLLLVFVVYTYYLAPVIGDDSAARLVVSTGFFLAIALSVLPLMRNVMGAHYMFLTNMLHLDTRINIEGRSKGSVCDAPLGFIVLKTDNNTKTFIPAGGTATSLTSVFHSHFWPLKLDIRLPPHTPAAQVRMFMQELDLLLFWDGRFLPRLATASVFEPPPPPSPAFSAANRSNRSSSVGQTHGDDTSKMLFELNLQEENQIVQRARGDDSYVALQANERWLIHFSTFIKGKRKPRFRQIRAAYIDAITRLLEQQGIGYAGQQQITPSSYT